VVDVSIGRAVDFLVFEGLHEALRHGVVVRTAGPGHAGQNRGCLEASDVVAAGEVKNYRDSSIPLGRRFRALKLWRLLRAEGVEGLQTRLRRDTENARWLEGEVRRSARRTGSAPSLAKQEKAAFASANVADECFAFARG
jgi:hypothetical protein